MDRYSELGRRIKQERETIGLTQRELAERFGIDKSSVYLYERGTRPPPANLLMVLAELGADVYFIITGKRIESSMTEEWLHRTMIAARELDETGVWQKLDWDERERLIAKLL